MSSIKETADRYREEMMKLYGNKMKSGINNDNVKSEETENNAVIEEQKQDIPQRLDLFEENNSMNMNQSDSIESRYPEPVIPAFMREQTDVNEPDEDTVPMNNMVNTEDLRGQEANENEKPAKVQTDEEADAYGYLLVQARTLDSGIPIPNAAVKVSRTIDGAEKVYVFTKTDMNGKTEIIKLPTIKLKKIQRTPEDFEQSLKYDVSVYMDNFFTETSVNVPIFENIKSIQTFNMIPEPKFGSNDETIRFSNTEPEI